MELPFKSEKACGILTIDLVKKKGFRTLASIGANDGSPPPSDTLVFHLADFIVPSGWLYFERLNYCALFDLQKEGAVDLDARTISPGEIASTSNNVFRIIHGGTTNSVSKVAQRHCDIAGMLLPALNRFPFRIATGQTAADQAAVACALERYRLVNDRFPDQLESLKPLFIALLPHDVITGDPYKYRRTRDGQFILYSVGWNETDDGGVTGKTLFDQTNGDWVW